MMKSKRPVLWTAVIALGIVGAGQAQQSTRGALRMVAQEASFDPSRPSAQTWTVGLQPQTVLDNPARLTIDLPDGTQLEAQRESWTDGEFGFSWDGRVLGQPEEHSLITLSVAENRIAGVIDTGAARYRVQPAASGHRVTRDTQSHAECAGGVVPPRDLVGQPEAQEYVGVAEEAGRPVVRILVVYTPSAAGVVGNAIQASATSAVRYLNRVIDNTGTSGSAVLAGAVIVDSLGSLVGLDEYLPAVRNNPDVARIRAETRADIVELFVGFAEAGGDCGLGYLLERGDTSARMAPWAFGATSIRCDPEATFAHEVGHTLGLNHNPSDAGSPNPFEPWSYGHRNGSSKTTMSYGSQREIPHFSNPDVTAGSFVTGIEGQRDNARTLERTMSIASGYVGAAQFPTLPAPTNLTATLESASTVLLRWTDVTDNETGFRVEQRFEQEPWTAIADVAANVTEARAQDLQGGSSYRFRVRTLEGGTRSDPSNIVLIDTPAGAKAPERLHATPTGTDTIDLAWEPVAVPSNLVEPLLIEMRTVGEGWRAIGTVDNYSDAVGGGYTVTGLEPERPYTFRALMADAAAAAGELAAEASATTLGFSGACRQDARSLCLLDDRFEVRVDWDNPRAAGDVGTGRAVPIDGTDESGLFWFFNDTNIELVVKMFDVGFTESFWHYYGALTDVEYWITVRDTLEGSQRTYHNQPLSQCGFGDINAFPSPRPSALSGSQQGIVRGSNELSATGKAGSVPLSGRLALPSGPLIGSEQAVGTCVADEQTLCFGEGRFAVTVDFQAGDPLTSNVGQTLPGLTTDDTGFFWFFTAGNVELAIKILDARILSGTYWLFWGALSDVEYQVSVEDTVSGEVLVIDNPAGSLCGGSNTDTLGAP